VEGILADVNVQGHVALLRRLWESEPFAEIWAHLNLPVVTLADVGLPEGASDAEVWWLCQERQLLLITANRNKDGEDSLEETIRKASSADCLPVVTFADADHFRRSKEYAERVAEKLLEKLLDIDTYRGAGRLYVP
jgi:hypothetical protein